MPSTVQKKRNRYALAVRLHGHGSPEATAARAELAGEKIADYVEKVVAEAPPLTAAQVDRVIRALSNASASED